MTIFISKLGAAAPRSVTGKNDVNDPALAG